MKLTFILLIVFSCLTVNAQSLYQMPVNVQSRLSSFENLDGVKGAGGQSNHTAKGHPYENILPGQTKTLLDISSAGIVQRIWLTIDQTPVKLRSLRLQIFWDHATKPAVDVPLGDFFGYNQGRPVAFQSALFSSGEGRSFNCYIPMPFRTGAKIVLVNEGPETAKLFFDVDFVQQPVDASALYFHAFWNRQLTAKLGTDYEPLPRVSGKGRFLGISVALNADSSYGKSWWGEGEIKMYLDGDTKFPTINGTGLEDYLGSAWGLGSFVNQYQGCTVSDDSLGRYSFYRFHIPDAIYFTKDIRVAMQQIGGWDRDHVQKLLEKGANLQPITVDAPGAFTRLLELKSPPSLTDNAFTDGWVNFYRVDDYASVSYFYLDSPTSGLPPLPSVSVRLKNVPGK